jgi:hypothetical protein
MYYDICQHNIRDAPLYLKWKTRVENRLNEFKQTQSNKTSAPLLSFEGPTPLVDTNIAPPDKTYNWEVQQTSNKALMASTEAINRFVTQASQATNPTEALCASTDAMNAFVSPASTPTTPPKPKQDKNNLHYQNFSANKSVCKVHSQAKAFVQTRPEGPLQETDRDMKALTRTVASTVAKKCQTSIEGRDALAEVGSMTANNNKENVSSVERADTGKRKKSTKLAQTSQKRKATTKKNPIVSETPVDNERSLLDLPPACKYGCQHAGIIALIQMMPEMTRHYLKESNFFHQKECVDCKQRIDLLFARSKNNAIFYYCQVDFNVSNLDDDKTAIAAQSCDCIMCLSCYFKRTEKRDNETGTATRASRRQSSRQHT